MDSKRTGTRGKIYVTANSVSASNDVAKMDIMCRIEDPKEKGKKGFLCFCKPPEDNPWLLIERQGPNDEKSGGKINWIKVWDSEEHRYDYKSNLSPVFKKISIHMFKLCNQQITCPLRFSLYSRQANGSDLLYGTCEISAKEILNQKADKERELINEKAKVKTAGFI